MNKINHDLFEAKAHALEHRPCPECAANGREGVLEVRHGKRGPFLGCKLYPECEYIEALHNNDGHIIKSLEVPCPECQSQARNGELVLRQGRYGMFIGCSLYPECTHIESKDEPKQVEESEQLACPECQKGELVARNSRFGKRFYACNAYPKCKFSLNLEPQAGVCQSCGFKLLALKKTAKGESLVCADRKCQALQNESLQN